MITTIIFDYGGVFSINHSLTKFCEDNAEKFNVDVEEFKELVRSIWMKARIGEIDSERFWIEISKFINIDPVDFKELLNNPLDFRDELLEYVLGSLKGNYKLGMISNHIKSWLEPMLARRGLRDVFDEVITSYESGAAKPDVKIYEDAMKRLDVEAENCIFIDDLERNLVPARELGMKTIQFTSFDQFHKEITELLK